MERVYVIPLREAYKASRHRRSKRAMGLIKEFVAKHTKAKEVRLSPALSKLVWRRSAEKPPRRVKVKVKVEESVVEVEPA